MVAVHLFAAEGAIFRHRDCVGAPYISTMSKECKKKAVDTTLIGDWGSCHGKDGDAFVCRHYLLFVAVNNLIKKTEGIIK